MKDFKKGQIVEIIDNGFGKQWDGFRAEVTEDKRVQNEDYFSPWLRPLSPRPDDNGLAGFFWAARNLRLVVEEEACSAVAWLNGKRLPCQIEGEHGDTVHCNFDTMVMWKS